jgi:hypothetical protein
MTKQKSENLKTPQNHYTSTHKTKRSSPREHIPFTPPTHSPNTSQTKPSHTNINTTLPLYKNTHPTSKSKLQPKQIPTLSPKSILKHKKNRKFKLPPKPLTWKIPTKPDPPLQQQYSFLGKSHHTSTFNTSLHIIPSEPHNTNTNTIHHFDMVPILRTIQKCKLPKLQPSPWNFNRTKEAAIENTTRIQQFNYNMELATQTPPNTIMCYGTEFKPSDILEPLLKYHQDWEQVKSIIDNGVEYPLNPIEETDRINDIKALIERGNHKSALTPENKAALNKAFTKETTHQWAIPLTPECIMKIPGASVTPLGVAEQWTINEHNERIKKRRTTHDCSFQGPSGNSCNTRVIPELLDECHYGHALRRFLHGIHNIRSRHPQKTIWLNKTDMDAAYRRLHTNMTAAVTCITIIDDIGYLLNRVPFGSTPAPSKFSCVSDMAGDLAQDLCTNSSWNPPDLHSTFDLDFPPCKEPDDIPFGQADELLVPLPPRNIITDNFIDDFIQACLDQDDNAERIKHAVPLILETLFRPIDTDDPSNRDPIVNMTKHRAEGKLEERKVVLGWLIDSRRFRVFLTPDKSKEWIYDMNKCIDTSHCKLSTLESIIGRLNHTSCIVHLGRYFLTRLRYRLHKNSHKHKNHTIKLAPWEIDDLALWTVFLYHLTDNGISINNICITKPTITTYSDACEFGLGGYTSQGYAWRYLLPRNLRGKTSINFLEFLAAIITIELSLQHDTHTTTNAHIMAFTDNSSALGWMYHSTFNPVKDKNHDKLARHLAFLLFKKEATLHSEHIPGDHNIIADSLSRDFHLNDTTLTSLLLSHPSTTSQVPNSFKIHNLNTQTTSWIASLVDSTTPTKESPPEPSPSSLAQPSASKNSSTNATSHQTHSLTTSPPTRKSSSPPPTPTMCEETDTNTQTKKDYKERLLLPPSPTWFRPSGRTFGLIPLTTAQDTVQQSSHAK